MKKTEDISELLKALFEFQKTIGQIKTTATNPFFRNKYIDLAGLWQNIKKPLHNTGLGITQLLKGHGVETILFHPESGQYISECAELKPVKEDPQGYGSAITYTKRYAILAVLGIVAEEDDDANKGCDNVIEKPIIEKGYTSQKGEKLELKGEMVSETEKAYKVVIGNFEGFLPKSKVSYQDGIFFIPKWLAKNNNIS